MYAFCNVWPRLHVLHNMRLCTAHACVDVFYYLCVFYYMN
jgi:hypothetical protein